MRFALLLVSIAAMGAPQTAQFEVASIRPAAVSAGREGGNRARIEHTPNSLRMWNVDLTMCLEWAYDLQPFQIAAEHVRAESYDILAKAGESVPVSQLRIMLQNLLAERFQLALHRATKMFPVYHLTVAKGGPRLTRASSQAVHAAESIPRIDGDSFVFAGVTMGEFARMLAQLRGIGPVVDRTGIAGSFDIRLKSAPEAAREADTGALMAILEEQTGLKLVAGKAPFEMVVIDHAEKPSEN